MGGVVGRTLAAFGTLGLSETGQKKPFQDFGNDNPTSAMGGGPLRFIPGGSQIAAALEVAQPSPKAPEPGEPPTALVDKSKEKEKEKEANDSERRRQESGRGRVSTMLTTLPFLASRSPAYKTFLGGY